MAPRLTAALAAGALACLAAAGCASRDLTTSGPTSPSAYVDAVQSLLDPPARLASAISERASTSTAPVPPRQALDRLVGDATDQLSRFRALSLSQVVLRRQRDRLAAAYARMLPRMRAAADALAGGDRAGLTAAATPFLDSLGALTSAAASER